MKITLSQLKQIIKEEVASASAPPREKVARGNMSQEEWEEYTTARAKLADAPMVKADAERKPVPRQAVQHVLDQVYDKGGKWFLKTSDEVIDELLTGYGYKSPNKYVYWTDISQVKNAIYSDPRYKTSGGATRF